MSLKDYQKQVDEAVNKYKQPYWDAVWISSQISEEAGEIAREINHMYGPKKKKLTEDSTKDFGTELSDLVFAIICMANVHGINLDAAFDRTMHKIYERDKDRFEKKQS